MSSSRSIAHVFPSRSWGGAEMYALKLARWQAARGERVFIWATEGSRLAQEASVAGLNVLTEPLPERQPGSALWHAARVIRENRITHLHLHWAGGVWVFAGIKLLAHVKVFCHIHLWISLAKRDPLHRLLFSSIDAFIVAGDRAREAARDLWGISESRLRVVPYAIETDKFVSVPSVRAELSKIADPNSWRWIGMFARIDRQKGTLEFLEALKPVLSRFAGLSVMIVGEPNAAGDEYAREVQAAHASHPFRERIHFFGFRKDYLSLMNECELIVAPSYHESYSLAFLDAFALGRPVLTTDTGGSPDLIQEPKHGWLTRARDAGALAQDLARALESSDEIHRRGEMAKKAVFQRHSPESVVQALDRIYSGD